MLLGGYFIRTRRKCNVLLERFPVHSPTLLIAKGNSFTVHPYILSKFKQEVALIGDEILHGLQTTNLAFPYLLKHKSHRVNKGRISVVQVSNSTVVQFTQTIGAC